jgi:hypothetical protein
LQSQITAAGSSEAFFANTIKSLELNLDDCDRDVREAVSNVPTGLNITSMEFKVDGITIKGVAQTQTMIMTYAKTLRSSGRFNSVVVPTVETKTEGLLNFRLLLD